MPGASRPYPPELRERAVRMVAEISDQHESEWAAMGEVARLLGIGTAETVRKWDAVFKIAFAGAARRSPAATA